MTTRSGILIVLFAFVLGCDSPRTSAPQPSTSTPAGSASTTPEQTAAAESLDYAKYAVQAHKVVKQFLKHPLDANFDPGLLNAADVRQVEPDRITVKGTVVCKNDFGGELTKTYAVAFTDSLDVVMVLLDNEIMYGNPEFLPSNEGGKANPAVTFRNWTDDTGQYTIEAEFIEFKDGNVHLRKRDGSVKEMSPNRLSKEDVKWYRDEIKRRKAAGQ